MRVEPAALAGVLRLLPRRIGDARGWFSETFRAEALAAAGAARTWVQHDVYGAAQAGLLRGLRFQAPPLAQASLVQIVKGAAFAVAADLRRASPTFGRGEGFHLDGAAGGALFAPEGFAHGFLTLAPDTELFCAVSAAHAPALAGGVRWDDPSLGVAWPAAGTLTIAARDRDWPCLSAISTPF